MPGHGQAGHERHIICMKWGKKYGPEYVNRLYAMVRRHLSGDFRFVCLTDDASGIRSEVECKPIPPLDLPPAFQSVAGPSSSPSAQTFTACEAPPCSWT